MKQNMYVGAICSECKHTLKMGITETEPGIAPTLLHAQLRQEGWKEMIEEKCLREECQSKTTVMLDKTILLGPV